jgi:hypothetical protein
MAAWLAMAFAAAAGCVQHSIRTSDARGLLALGFPLFGCGLVALGFIPERRKAIQLLTEALAEPRPDTSPQPTSATRPDAYS